MKNRINSLREALPSISSTTDADYFHDEIDKMIAESEEHLEMIENSLLVLKFEIGVRALRYYEIENSKDQQ